MTITLTMQGLTPEVAMRVLRALGDAEVLVAVTPEPGVSAGHTSAHTAETVTSEPPAAGVSSSVQAPTAARAPSLGLGEPPSSPPLVGAHAQPPASPEYTPSNGGATALVTALADAAKLRDVVVYLHEKYGCKTAGDVLAVCTSVRERVPVLARITNLDERVRRTAELLGIE